MITERHNINEIKREIINDMEFIQEIQGKLSKPFGKIVLKRTNFKNPISVWKEVTSPSKNKYLICLSAEKRSDWKKPKFMKIAIWNTSNGIRTTSIKFSVRYGIELSICTAHFFHRYKERLGLRNISDIQLIEEFYNRNSAYYTDYLDDTILKYSEELKDAKGKIYVVFNDGIGFGNYLGNNDFQFNTFVSNDMMFSNQEEIVLPIRDKYVDISYDKWKSLIKIAA